MPLEILEEIIKINQSVDGYSLLLGSSILDLKGTCIADSTMVAEFIALIFVVKKQNG